MAIQLIQFAGIAPRIHPARLPASHATVARDCAFSTGALTAEARAATVMTLPNGKPLKRIFRIGQTITDETKYWLAFKDNVSICRGAIAGDTTERIYWTGADVPRQTTLADATQGGTSYPVNSWRLGVPVPDGSPIATVDGAASSASVTPETRLYVVTFVTAQGEEGAPCSASLPAIWKPGQTVALTGLPGVPTGAYRISAKRIYRSKTDAYGVASWRFVAEVAAATTGFTDTVADDALGEVLATETYLPPPDSMQHLTAMPNGIYAGADGFQLYFSAPYLPYAWPEDHRLTVDARVVGMASFGQSLLIATEAQPYLASGIDPAGMSLEKLDIAQACASARSVLSVGSGAVYAGADGLVYVGAGGARVVTQSLMTRDQWQALKPSTMHCQVFNGRLFVFSEVATLAIDNFLADMPAMSELTLRAVDGYHDARHGALYLLDASCNLLRYGAGESLTATWRSALLDVNDMIPLSCAKVRADGGAVFRLYADGVKIMEKSVSSAQAFRLPAKRAESIQIEVETSGSVRGIWLASAMAELNSV